jgi:amino acid transporter
MTATSFAALTYIGFDGVTTLAEEVENPRRNVLVATVLVCAFTGIFSALQIYLAARVWPTYNNFPNVETAFLDVCGRAGGAWLFQAMAVTLLVAGFGSALTGQVGAARLLYGMGRDGVLPRSTFGRLSEKSNTPAFNILLIGLLTLIGCFTLSYEHSAEVRSSPSWESTPPLSERSTFRTANAICCAIYWSPQSASRFARPFGGVFPHLLAGSAASGYSWALPISPYSLAASSGHPRNWISPNNPPRRT